MAMKKILVLLGLAAATYGAVKFFKGNDLDEFAPDYAAPAAP